jgi:hypothetical protein
MFMQMADSLQHNSVIVTLTSTGWTAALIAILHYYTMFVLVGSMAIVDLGVLGFLGSVENSADIARRAFPWVWISLPVNLLSGFIMFAADANDYLPTWSFRSKLLVVLLAIVFSIAVHSKIPTSDQPSRMPASAKILAVLSILFWVGAILMGVEVPAIAHVG